MKKFTITVEMTAGFEYDLTAEDAKAAEAQALELARKEWEENTVDDVDFNVKKTVWNREPALRKRLLTPYFTDKEYGGTRHFEGLPLNVLKELIKDNFVDMERWNECPAMKDGFLPFMESHTDFLAHGYAVSWERTDARITVEGLEWMKKQGTLSKKEIAEFARYFHGADEFEVQSNYARCWYD